MLFDSTTIPFAITQAATSLDQAIQPGWGVALWIDCDHVDELYAKLVARGTTIITAPENSLFGRKVVFADPDGYRITANENPWDQFPLGGRR